MRPSRITYSIMKIYISGPISGLKKETYERRFAEAETYLRGLNFETVSPLRNGLPDTASWNDHMMADLTLLAECDGIFLMKGWEKSKGCQIELQSALVWPQIRYIIKDPNIIAPICTKQDI